MSPTLKALGIDQLSVAERLLLVEEIWDSISANPDAIRLSPAQIEELDRRRREHQADPNSSRPWAEVRDRLANRKK